MSEIKSFEAIEAFWQCSQAMRNRLFRMWCEQMIDDQTAQIQAESDLRTLKQAKKSKRDVKA